MTPLALCLVLTAAVLHATWNLAAKRAGSGLPFVFAVGVVMTICYVPIIAGVAWFGGGLHFSPGDWFVVGVSTVLKTGYALYLQRAYRKGDFSLVYPLVRGSAPVIATAGAALFLGEFPPPIALLGGLIIVAGIFFLTHGERLWQRRPGRAQPPRGALGNALIAGSFIATYTVWDRNAVAYHAINPVVFDGLTNIGLTVLLLPFALPRRAAVTAVWRDHRREVLIMAILSPLAYVLVLTALRFTPVGYVAPAREVSILIGTYLGARVFRESDSPRRAQCAIAIIVGLFILATA